MPADSHFRNIVFLRSFSVNSEGFAEGGRGGKEKEENDSLPFK